MATYLGDNVLLPHHILPLFFIYRCTVFTVYVEQVYFFGNLDLSLLQKTLTDFKNQRPISLM